MWWFIQTIAISIIIIAILHYSWEYIKKSYSTRITKDIVKIQTAKYDTILSEILENKHSSPEYTINDDEMEKDLAMFLEQTISNTK
jgi:hypothetical protein